MADEKGKRMNRCKICVMPDTRPDTPFIDGVCAACVSHAKRPKIDWEARKQELIKLLDRHNGRCIVPSSGGKDSHYQVLTLLELGADVTVVTATTCHLTQIGRANIDNLARYARTIEVTPNKTVRAKLNRLGMELVGDISWPEHVSIFTIPFNMAADLGINLIMYGENPQEAYGGPEGTDQASRMTARWRSEFGGFLGLRPADLIGTEGITSADMRDYRLKDQFIDTSIPSLVEAHFLGHYIEWDSRRNADVALDAGMRKRTPCESNWWSWENLDNAMTGLHDYFGWLKYGYGRGCAQISVDIRSGWVSREDALAWLAVHEGSFPWNYGGVQVGPVLDQMRVDIDWLWQQVGQWTNKDLFEFGDSSPLPDLKEDL